MPLRGFMYFGHLYNQYIRSTKQDIYGKTLVKIPYPQYIVFYNGTDKCDDKTELKLSDAFINKKEENRFEWTATMLNINAGHNRDLMDKCLALKEYSGFIQLIRDYNKSLPLEQAVDMAVKEAGNWQCLGRFLQKHRSEVVSVVLMEYDEKLQEDTCFKEGIKEGLEQATVSAIINITRSLGCSVEKAINVLNIPASEQEWYKDIVIKKLKL